MDEILKKKLDNILLEGIESLSIEFKREWHWTRKDEDTNKVQWDKFLRNFSGLINTTEEDHIPIKYFIIGYDEKTKKTHDYKIDKDHNLLLFFQNKELVEIKKEIIKKLKKKFEIVNYGEEDFLKEDFEKILNEKMAIATHTYKDNELLVFVIEPLPFLLSLKENHTLGKIKEKEIPYRKIKNKEPGVYALDREEEIIVKQLILKEWNKYKLHSPKNSIQVIVDAYNTSFYKKGKIINYEINIPYSNSSFYEMFGLEHRGKKEILFIYFSKYTSIKKTLEEILENYLEFEEYKEIFLILEGTHNISQRFKLEEHPKIYEIEDISITLIKKRKIIECYSPIFEFIDKKNYQEIKVGLEEENFFFSGNVTGVFIEPFIKETNKGILDSLKLWMTEPLSPIKFILGEGGIGKTTVVKNFSKSILSSTSNKKDILFINASDLIDNISSIEINSLYDFVKLFIEKEDIVSDDILNENMFNILLDSGKFLIVIDGLDEAILNSKEFNSVDFIKNIYDNCLNNLGRTKVLCTIRSSFWEKEFQSTSIGEKIEKITLRGFDEKLVKDFFRRKINDDRKIKNSIKKIEQILGKKDEYIPFHLNMIIDIQEQEIPNILESNLLVKNIPKDCLVYGICDRECVKFEDLKTIDEQLNIFIEISTSSLGGECTSNQLEELTKDKYKSYISHPLLSSIGEDTNKKYELKYDILKDDFKELFFVRFVKNFLEDKETIEVLLDENNQNLILTLNLFSLKERFKETIKIEDMEYLIVAFIDSFDIEKVIKIKDKKIISFLFSLTLSLLDKQDKPSYTELLKNLFEKDGKLHYVSILNSQFIDKKTFNFRELKFYDSYIDYKYFGDSDFDSNTFFEKSTILGKGYFDKCNFKKENFSNTCELSEEIKSMLNKREDESKNQQDIVTTSVKRILKKMYKNNFIRIPKERGVKHLKGLDIKIFDFLVKENIIKEEKYTSKEKRVDEYLEIEERYHLLLEEIFEGQKSINKTLSSIVDKFMQTK